MLFKLLVVACSALSFSLGYPCYANDVFQKAKRCQKLGGVWLENNCVIDVDGKEQEQTGTTIEAIPLSSPENNKNVEKIGAQGSQMQQDRPIDKSSGSTNKANVRRLLRIEIGVGYPFKKSEGKYSLNPYTVPEPLYTPNPSGTFDTILLEEVQKGSVEFSSEPVYSLGVSNLAPYSFGYTAALLYMPASKMRDIEDESNSKADRLERLLVEGRVCYSFAGVSDETNLVSLFIGLAFPFESRFTLGDKDTNVDEFDVDPSRQYGVKVGLSKNLQLDLFLMETPINLKLSVPLSGEVYQRNANGNYSRTGAARLYGNFDFQIRESLFRLSYQFN